MALLAAALPSTAAADHWYWSSAWPINQPGTVLSSYSHSDGNWGDPAGGTGLEPSEPDRCQGPGGTNYFQQTVWFQIHPHAVGDLSIRATTTTSGFKPVVHLTPWEPAAAPQWTFGPCEVTGAGGVAALPTQRVAAGSHYKIQIGGDTTGTVTTGSYHLDVLFDPDSDGDGLLDSADGCDSQPGPGSNGGCPPGVSHPDRDGDHIPDHEDDCPDINASKRDRDHDGCLDIIVIRAVSDLDAGYFLSPNRRPLGVKVLRLRIKRLPAKARVELRCKRNGRKVCRRQIVVAKRAGTIQFRRMRGKNLRAGTRLYIRATLPKAIGRYIEYRITRGNFKKIERCLKPGSRRPAKRC